MLSGVYEFRGKEDRTSQKTGKRYVQLNVEDLENGASVTIFCSSNVLDTCGDIVDKLSKGDTIKLDFNYHYNGFERKNTADLVNVSMVE